MQLIRLGTALGLKYPHLQRMQILPDDMVAAWLNIEDEVMDISGIPTWSSLIKALEDTDQKGVASRIRKGKFGPPYYVDHVMYCIYNPSQSNTVTTPSEPSHDKVDYVYIFLFLLFSCDTCMYYGNQRFLNALSRWLAD